MFSVISKITYRLRIRSIFWALSKKPIIQKVFTVIFTRKLFRRYTFTEINELKAEYPDRIFVLNQYNSSLCYSIPHYYTEIYNNTTTPLLIENQNEVTVVDFNNASVIGGSSLILLDEKFAFYDLKSKIPTEHPFKFTDQGIVYYNGKNLMISESKSELLIDECINLTGNFSWNFYHLLYEIVVKFQFINQIYSNHRIPVLLDEICLKVPQFKQLIDAFNLFGLEYIPAIKGKLYPIHKLHHITCPNIIPPDYSKPAAMKSSDILYSIDSLEYLKNTMLSQKAEMDFPDKVYLSRRNASNRRKFNEDEVFEMLKKYGFDEVLPEDYTINEQVALFNQAKIIVTGSGAALTNVLFCSEKCRIVVLVKDELLFSGFSSLASFSNAEMIYMVSDEKSENVKKIHSSFKINVSNLEKLIKKIL